MFRILSGFIALLVIIAPAFALAGEVAQSRYKIIIREADTEKAQQKNLPTGDSIYDMRRHVDAAHERPAPALDEPRISLTAFNKRLGDALIEIGSKVGYTVIFGPQVDPNAMVIANFKDTPLSSAVSAITSFVNSSYEIDHAKKTITVLRTITRTFSIPAVAISVPIMTAEMGGDMVGGGGGGGAAGGGMGMGMGGGGGAAVGAQSLKASVALKKTDVEIDSRRLFEDNIRKLLSPDGHYVLDWLSAILMVTDAAPNIKLIEEYINNIREATEKQLVVYATITQVSTTKDFRYGIDWNVLAKRLSGEVLTDARRGKELRLETAVTDIAAPTLTITRTAADISAVLRALEEQGDVKVLANPYIFARNLQPVAIFSGKSIPYISSIQRTVTGVVGEATTSFEIARAQDGIMLAVRTYVRDDGDIDVQIMPILSSIDEFVTFNIEGNVFTNPVSSVQQTMQSVTVSDGETVVIGGVKRERAEVAEKSVPLLSNIPLLGALFMSEAETDNRSELVIALKVKKVDRTAKSR